jgi:hypothetical protein
MSSTYTESPGVVEEVEVETAVLRQFRLRRSDRFLKGPIPPHSIAAAARLPGQALAVLLAVHHQITLTGKPSVSLPGGLLAELGTDRNAKARALHQLERAGLIQVERARGRAARVRLAGAERAANGTRLTNGVAADAVNAFVAAPQKSGERLQAANVHLAHGYGRPVQTQNPRGTGHIEDPTDEGLAAIVAEPEEQHTDCARG